MCVNLSSKKTPSDTSGVLRASMEATTPAGHQQHRRCAEKNDKDDQRTSGRRMWPAGDQDQSNAPGDEAAQKRLDRGVQDHAPPWGAATRRLLHDAPYRSEGSHLRYFQVAQPPQLSEVGGWRMEQTIRCACHCRYDKQLKKAGWLSDMARWGAFYKPT